MMKIELISHFTQELDAHQAYLLLGVIITEFLLSYTEPVALTLLEIFENILHVVLVHYLIDVVVNVNASS